MSLKTLELKPDRLLMDSNFDGYKLSLDDLNVSKKTLEIPIDRTVLASSQYGLLHAKLFGLHNSLFGDRFDNFTSVYFVDQQFKMQKIYVDPDTNQLVDPIEVFTIPKLRERTKGDYNTTLCFASPAYAVCSDGMGTLLILATRDKKDDDTFELLYSEKVLDNQQGYVISDAMYNKDTSQLHVLLLNIEEDALNRFVSVIHWLTFKQEENVDGNKSWGQVALRQLKTRGEVQYLHLEKNGDHIYVVSENNIEFVLNSEHPIQDEPSNNSEKIYQWSQNIEEITVKVSLPKNAQKNLVKVLCERSMLKVSYNDETLVSGELEGFIDASLMTWELNAEQLLIIELHKVEGGPFWTELIKGDTRGTYVLDTCIIDQANETLQKYTSENTEIPPTGTTFNSQQIEECDFETDKSEIFDRISGVTNETTHRIHLGSHQVILSPYITSEWPPALGIRHDVDVCIWQPLLEGDNFTCKHEGTLLAFGYVQASKTNRKFVTCSPNLNYAVVSESAGHIFIYRQNRPLLSSELRHRSSGRRVKSMAQQQVFNLPNQEILGLFANNTHLFILGENFVISLSINGPEPTE
ncbi:nudC domain-containing protein 1 isoform X1 [Anthonomus grandis grandis]|uniref:nudC domain-containing protein 1 isoform X1 n=1 Tax=Anthonomus grandis grandis TaxID=2921223 RepID=UPI00216531E9|nr:nudC domain-containing protein 1 isoform X1 [Anthonomus grandis grandis]